MDAQTCSLEDEAGISAYWNVGSEINLNKAREAYKSIDTETDEYIIGIVQTGWLEELYPSCRDAELSRDLSKSLYQKGRMDFSVYSKGIFRRRDFSMSRSELCDTYNII